MPAPGRAGRRASLGLLDGAPNELLARTGAAKRSRDLIAPLGDLDRRVPQAVRRRDLDRAHHLWPDLPEAA